MTLSQQDQDAINHIASVSKHKHAAIIARWLITGWIVEFKNISGDWCKDKYPGWGKETEYRLIEPKPKKPAYRVYKTGNIANTVIRFEDGSYTSNYKENLDWIGDWTEYYPDQKKWPTPLVERIAAIDISAAEWIVDHWDDLLEARYIGSNNYSRDSDKLSNMFVWVQSDQGWRYWIEISEKLGER